MPAKNKTLSVYPDPTALAIVGGNSPACNRAIEAFARIVREHEPQLDRQEWLYLADVLNGSWTDASWTGDPYLVAEIGDAHELNRTGDKWFCGEGEEIEAAVARAAGKRARTSADKRVARLIEKVRGWDYATAQACLVAVRWFWDHHEAIDTEHDAWWTAAFRTQTEAAAD